MKHYLLVLILASAAIAQQAQIPNAGTTGTTANKLAKLNSSGQLVITATTDTSGIEGPCVAGCGTSGNAIIAKAGLALVQFDGATTAGDYVQQSTVTGGLGHDAGASCPSSGQVLGRVLSTNGSSGTYAIVVGSEGCGGSGGGGGIPYPGAGVPNSTGSAWGTSYAVGTAANNLVQLTSGAALPAVSAANLTSFPTLNQNTTGTAGGLLGCTPGGAGDICYWNGTAWTLLSGNRTASNYFLQEISGVPQFTTPPGGGNVSNSGVPVPGQVAIWSSSTVIQGVTTLPLSAMPTLTGDVSNSGFATTVIAINGGSVPVSAKLLGTSSSQPIAAALTSAHIYLGNGSNLPVDVALSQDVSITNAGAVTVAGLQTKALPALSAFSTAPYLTYTGSAWAAANPFASPTFTGTVTTPITGTTQCLQVNSSGVLAGTGSACGSGGGGGNVTGPGSSTVGHVAYFNNTSGSLLGDAGYAYNSIPNADLQNSTIGIAGTSNQISSSTASPALGGSTTLSLANPLIFPGKWTGAASTTSAATFNTPSGSAPTSPVSGDHWNLSGILQFYDGTHTNSITTIQTAPTSGDLAQFSGTAGLLSDSTLVAANVVTQASNGAANQIATYSGSNKVLVPATTLPTAAVPSFTGDMTNSSGSLTTVVGKVNGVSYGASPSTNTVPVVTGTNAVTYEAVPNAALANSATTVNSQTCTLGSTCTIPFQVNTTANASQAGLNFNTSSTNAAGLTVTPVNTATNQVRFEVTGTALVPLSSIQAPTGNTSISTSTYTTTLTSGDFTSSPVAGIVNLATSSTSTTDTSYMFTIASGTSSYNHPANVSVDGFSQLAVCNIGGSGHVGEVVIGNLTSSHPLNSCNYLAQPSGGAGATGAYNKFLIIDNSNARNSLTVLHTNTTGGSNNNLVNLLSAAAVASGLNFINACAGTTNNDGTCNGTNVATLNDSGSLKLNDTTDPNVMIWTINTNALPTLTAGQSGIGIDTIANGGGIKCNANGAGWTSCGSGGGGSGTVTSIGVTVPTGLSVTPSTITTNGTFAITWSGTIPNAQIPAPTTSALGGIEAVSGATSNSFMTYVDASGIQHVAQPSFSNLSGNISISQMNSGTSASSSTFWRGDGTWATPAGSGTVTSSGYSSGTPLAAFSTSTNITPATSSNVTALFSGTCSSSTFLRGDGSCNTPAGSGTVTSIATTSPITGGTITTSGTIACATCVVASSPGVGIAHFAGSTQTVTSSTIATADIASGAVTSAKLSSTLALPSATTATTQAVGDTTTSVATDQFVNQNVVLGTYDNDSATTTLTGTFSPPVGNYVVDYAMNVVTTCTGGAVKAGVTYIDDSGHSRNMVMATAMTLANQSSGVAEGMWAVRAGSVSNTVTWTATLTACSSGSGVYEWHVWMTH